MTLWRGESRPVLASKSMSRQSLLRGAGIPFDIDPADIDERALQAAAGPVSPGRIAALLAAGKARVVSNRHPGRIVIGADQTLALGARLFNKPADRAAAMTQLQALSGRTHELHSAIAIARDGQVLDETVAVARMTFRVLDETAVARYLDLAGDVVLSSVGAYQLEGLGVHLFERIEGDYFTILGLPLVPLLASLRRLDLLAI